MAWVKFLYDRNHLFHFDFFTTKCILAHNSYQFDLDGTGVHPHARYSGDNFKKLTVNFWFKTAEKNVSYFAHGIPDDTTLSERFTIWRVENIFFVKLWIDGV